MSKFRWVMGLAAVLMLSLPGIGAAGGTDRSLAIEAGAIALSSDEIAELVVGHTVTVKSGQKTFRFYYGADNELSGKLVGGNWSDSGYYAINDKDEVCLSISKDRGRLRCISLLRTGDTVRKYNAAGAMTFEIVKVEAGNRL